MTRGIDVRDVVDALRDFPAVGGVSCFAADGSPCDPGQVGERPLSDVTYDSRAVVPGALFACKGAAFREEYLADAAASGAVCYLSDRRHPQAGIPGIVVGSIRPAMAVAADRFFRHPSGELSVIALTGTKGKTTTSLYIDAILRARESRLPGASAPGGHGGDLRPRNAVIGGLYIDDGTGRRRSANTTPEAIELQRTLRRAADSGCDVAVMEASSQGFKYDRTLCTDFAVGVFTNIGEDHISPVEHPTFEDYLSCKLRIFDQSRVGVVNLASEHVGRILDRARRRCERVLTYDARIPAPGAGDGSGAAKVCGADVYAREARRLGRGRWQLTVITPSGDVTLGFRGLGEFNVGNAIAAIAACEALGVDHDAMRAGLADVRVPGRMELHETADGSLVGIIDYAHNGMSMRALLGCARQEFPDRQLTVVFGSCGERGLDRREGLGRAAGELADRIILTEDEPGGVDPRAICEEIGRSVTAAGASYEVVLPRERAVRRAVEGARRPAVVVLAGKGPEDTMLRAHGDEPYGPDARLFCEAAGIEGAPRE